MRTLILVDLDNVLRPDLPKGERPEAWYLPADEGKALRRWAPSPPAATFVRRGCPPLPEDSAVVVFAFNEITANARGSVPLRAQYLLNLAQCIVDTLAVSGEACVEPMLVRTVPQAADLALLTALERAPDASTCGPFEVAILVSNDGGLRLSIEARLNAGSYAPDRATYLSSHTWVLRVPLTRAAPAPPAPRSPTKRPPSGWSAAVTSAEHVAAVEAHTLDWPSTGEFSSLAGRVTKRVERLSMLGLTESSSRGVARLGELLTTPSLPVRLGPLSPTDGVEWPSPEPFGVADVRDAVRGTIGEGSVRFPSVEATLATRLPSVVVSKAAATGRLEVVAPLPSSRVLKCFRRRLVPLGEPRVRVRCERRRADDEDRLRFSVVPFDGRVPGWWVDCRETSQRASDSTSFPEQATAEIEERAPLGLAITRETFDAEMIVDDRLSEPRVDLAAPNVGELTVHRATRAWELAIAAPDRRSVLVLLPPPSVFAASGRIEVCRIQELDGPPRGWDFDQGFWHFLKRAPLLVPCHWARPAAVPAARGAT